MRAFWKIISFFVLTGLVFFTGCNLPSREVEIPLPLEQRYEQIISTLASQTLIEPTITPEDQLLTAEENPSPENKTELYFHPGLPEKFRNTISDNPYNEVETEEKAQISILMGALNVAEQAQIHSNWIYALAVPFYTITDNISFGDLSAFWKGQTESIGDFSNIAVMESTKAALSTILGPANDAAFEIISEENLTNIPLNDNKSLYILPFELLNNRMKVIRIDSKAPIDVDFDPQTYPLSVGIWVETDLENPEIELPESNYNPKLRTILVMTGVTALTRATAHRMELQGNQYPGQDIHDWLTSADLTHISNEVPFAANCPPPDPIQQDLIFCSSPERIELLEYVETDIVELTGNHLLDYGLDAVNLTLEMYAERDWVTYAGGWDLEDAQTPALVNHNGNQLAFIGCNSVGPPNAWASTTKPGAAPCGDFAWMTDEIQKLKDDGYLPIVTLQYAEDYTDYPGAQMVSDFKKLADAGAVVVNGSQAHTPKMMSFYGNSFLHYGLGNLFFDQMEVYYNDVYLSGTRDEFIDRLIFYDNELISVELLTALLEDYARPRPMTQIERDAFLSRIFSTAIKFDQ